jgi:hypothetical protein
MKREIWHNIAHDESEKSNLEWGESPGRKIRIMEWVKQLLQLLQTIQVLHNLKYDRMHHMNENEFKWKTTKKQNPKQTERAADSIEPSGTSVMESVFVKVMNRKMNQSQFQSISHFIQTKLMNMISKAKTYRNKDLDGRWNSNIWWISQTRNQCWWTTSIKNSFSTT